MTPQRAGTIHAERSGASPATAAPAARVNRSGPRRGRVGMATPRGRRVGLVILCRSFDPGAVARRLFPATAFAAGRPRGYTAPRRRPPASASRTRGAPMNRLALLTLLVPAAAFAADPPAAPRTH